MSVAGIQQRITVHSAQAIHEHNGRALTVSRRWRRGPRSYKLVRCRVRGRRYDIGTWREAICQEPRQSIILSYPSQADSTVLRMSKTGAEEHRDGISALDEGESPNGRSSSIRILYCHVESASDANRPSIQNRPWLERVPKT